MSAKDEVLAAAPRLVDLLIGAPVRSQGTSDVFHAPWREDRKASLCVVVRPDPRHDIGSWIDSGTQEAGNLFDLAGRVWGMPSKGSGAFGPLLRRCMEALGIPAKRPDGPVPAPIPVKRRPESPEEKSKRFIFAVDGVACHVAGLLRAAEVEFQAASYAAEAGDYTIALIHVGFAAEHARDAKWWLLRLAPEEDVRFAEVLAAVVRQSASEKEAVRA